MEKPEEGKGCLTGFAMAKDIVLIAIGAAYCYTEYGSPGKTFEQFPKDHPFAYEVLKWLFIAVATVTAIAAISKIKKWHDEKQTIYRRLRRD